MVSRFELPTDAIDYTVEEMRSEGNITRSGGHFRQEFQSGFRRLLDLRSAMALEAISAAAAKIESG